MIRNIHAVEAGREYRADCGASRLRFRLDGDNVHVHVDQQGHGLFGLDWFCGALSPDGIRTFAARAINPR